MNPSTAGRTIIFLLPYVLLLGGILAAGKVAGAPGGTTAVFQALGVATVGGVWVWLRARRNHR
ncbi:hypothetical protein ACWF94_02305 [Streptomyces sp. NPDC055078]